MSVPYSDMLDLRGLPCPGNLPRLIIKLETMLHGEVLKLVVDDIVALDRIPQALADESDFQLIETQVEENGNITMYIQII